MLHNNHIIKTLSNTIFSLLIVCVIFNSVNICSMAGDPVKDAAKLEEIRPNASKEQVIPGPGGPPFVID